LHDMLGITVITTEKDWIKTITFIH
jgi:hypothetical protein